MKFLYLLLLVLMIQSPALLAQEADEVQAATEQDCEQTVTLFQDVSRFGRKDRAAKNMTKRHAEMAAEGWRFIDMEVYVENGDLEGFYISYKRAVSCETQIDG